MFECDLVGLWMVDFFCGFFVCMDIVVVLYCVEFGVGCVYFVDECLYGLCCVVVCDVCMKFVNCELCDVFLV